MKKQITMNYTYSFRGTPIGSCLGLGPYTGITRLATVKYPNGRSIRFVLYAAYVAYGLIQPENNGIAVLDDDAHNGIAVLDDDARDVVADQIAINPAGGYSGPSEAQIHAFDDLLALPWSGLEKLIKSHPRARRAL